MDLDLFPAQVAAITAYLTGKLPQRGERGQNTLETAIIIVAVLGAAALLVTVITAAVKNHTSGIK